ncbi:MAG: hypothetical protein Q7S39_12190 [Ignavibacteria bacterium]|nr:hypothetical protein [Ignavibacteria bacterium]
MFFRALFIVCFCLLSTSILNAQSFGFGCFGFVGGYGGYSYQRYDPKGLNDFLSDFNEIRSDSLVSPMENFGKAQGYRVGLNFFRAKVENFVLSTKGYYQSVTEKHESLEKFEAFTRSTSMKLELRNWAIGIDLGISVTKDISWKVVDGALHFNTVILTKTENSTGSQTIVKKYRTESTTVGYTIGTGFILEIIDEYFSIEGAAGYTFLSIENLFDDDGTPFLNPPQTNQQVSVKDNEFIDAGGFNAVIQLNIGFPL